MANLDYLPPEERAKYERLQRQRQRNDRLLRHLEASSDASGHGRKYVNLLDAADALEVRANSPTLTQLEDIRSLLLEQHDAVDRLLGIIEPAIAELREKATTHEA